MNLQYKIERDRYLIEKKKLYIDDDITLKSGNLEPYEGELTQAIIDKAKRIKKRIEKGLTCLKRLEIEGIEWRDGLYLISNKRADDLGNTYYECCKDGGSNHVTETSEGASTSGGPWITLKVSKDGTITYNDYEATRYKILDNKKNTVRAWRTSPEGAGGMYFDVMLPCERLYFSKI